MKIQHITLQGGFQVKEPLIDLPRESYELLDIDIKGCLNSFETIDLGELAESCDENFIYETVSYGNEHELNHRIIAKVTGLNTLELAKLKKTGEISWEGMPKLIEYLKEYGFSFKDFIEFESVKKLKYDRIINANTDFYWLLGLYIGAGSEYKGMLSFVFKQNELKIMDKLKRILKKMNLEFGEYFLTAGHKRKIMIKSSPFFKLISKNIAKSDMDRTIPIDYLPVQDKKIQALINGLIESHGGDSDNRKHKFTTNSRKLAEIFQIVLDYMGNSNKMTKRIPINPTSPPLHTFKWDAHQGERKEIQMLLVRKVEIVNNRES